MLLVSRFSSRLYALGNPLNIGRGLGSFKYHWHISSSNRQHVVYEGRFFRLVGLQCLIVDTEDLSGVDCKLSISIDFLDLFDDDVFPKDTGIVNVDPIC
ncbi:hypothetical protein Tco_0132021 [Tanacetum coccineum]